MLHVLTNFRQIGHQENKESISDSVQATALNYVHIKHDIYCFLLTNM